MILKNVQMKKKQIAQSQWERCVCFRFCRFYPEDQSLADLAGRNPTSSQYAFVSSCMVCYLRMNECVCVCFPGDEGEAKSPSGGRKGEKKKGEMDEGIADVTAS